MLNINKLNKLFSYYVDCGTLSKEKIEECGFICEDITELIESGIVTKNENSTYSVCSVEYLYSYGVSLIKDGQFEKSKKCFQKCLEINPRHTYSCYHMFVNCILEENYDYALQLLKILLKNKDSIFQNDNRYYLYLLSIITDLPESYCNYAKRITFDDIKVLPNDVRYGNISLQNKIRTAAFEKKFTYALQQLRVFTVNSGKFTHLDKVQKKLLRKAAELETQSRIHLANLLRQKQYNEALEYLSHKNEKQQLSKMEVKLNQLIKLYLEIKKTSCIPVIKPICAQNITKAIDNNNFIVALNICTKYNSKAHFSNESSALWIILNDLCELIEKFIIDGKPNYDNAKQAEVLSLLFNYLISNDKEKAYKILNSYVIMTGNSKYESLIRDLIELSILEGDLTYSKPVEFLSKLNLGDDPLNIHNYIHYFYTSLSYNNLDIAKMCLVIIREGAKIYELDIDINKLEQMLKLSNYSNPNQFYNCDDAEKDVKGLFQAKYDELLKRKGIVLFEPLAQEKIDKITELSKYYPDIVSYVVGNNENKRVVLRYRPLDHERIEINKFIKLGNEAYNNGNYDECIKYYLLLIQYFKMPPAVTYMRIGMAYLKKSNIKVAIEYLTVATLVSSKTDSKYDFTDLISKLKNKASLNNGDDKQEFEMTESEFIDDSNYGITNFDDVDTLVSGLNMSIENACSYLGKDAEETDIIKLIYARAFYTQGDFKQGDLFLKTVEQNTSKTKKVAEILAQIKKNKKLYRYRQEKCAKQYSLSIKLD